METEESKLDREIFDRNTIIQTVQEGCKSEYWLILKQVFSQWRKEEQSYIDSFRKRGITEKDMHSYNRSIDRVVYLDKILAINETIIKHNTSIIEKAKGFMNTILKNGNFVFLREAEKNGA